MKIFNDEKGLTRRTLVIGIAVVLIILLVSHAVYQKNCDPANDDPFCYVPSGNPHDPANNPNYVPPLADPNDPANDPNYMPPPPDPNDPANQ